MSVHRSSTARLLHLIRLEVAPFPGRLSGSLRDVLGIVIAVTIVMTLRVPGISLALALIFLLQRERPSLTLRSGLQILGGCAFACTATLLWVQLTDGTEVARFLGILLGIFVAGFCMAATRYPLFFTIFGFYGFVNLSLWDSPPKCPLDRDGESRLSRVPLHCHWRCRRGRTCIPQPASGGRAAAGDEQAPQAGCGFVSRTRPETIVAAS